MAIKLTIFGSSGKLGSTIVRLASIDPSFVIDQDADLYIDASMPPGVVKHLDIALTNKKPIVIGVTGLTDETHNAIEEAAISIPILYAPNFSLGITLMQKFVQMIAQSLSLEGADIVETHHKEKKDAPSGTALQFANNLKKNGIEPTIQSHRLDNIVGKHELIFNTSEEQITLIHSAKKRDLFAKGSLKAAHFLIDKPPGLYKMDDLLR
jgi:4-hydroxy-tetrahydrodipicolinate reductase